MLNPEAVDIEEGMIKITLSSGDCDSLFVKLGIKEAHRLGMMLIQKTGYNKKRDG